MKFRKKPVVVDAVRWATDNYFEIEDFVGKEILFPVEGGSILIIKTLEGDMTAKPFDWIIKGVNGEFYPCKPDIFEKTYEPALPVQGVEEEDKGGKYWYTDTEFPGEKVKMDGVREFIIDTHHNISDKALESILKGIGYWHLQRKKSWQKSQFNVEEQGISKEGIAASQPNDAQNQDELWEDIKSVLSKYSYTQYFDENEKIRLLKPEADLELKQKYSITKNK